MDITEMQKHMSNHQNIKENFEKEWNQVLYTAENAKEEAIKSVEVSKDTILDLLSVFDPALKEIQSENLTLQNQNHNVENYDKNIIY